MLDAAPVGSIEDPRRVKHTAHEILLSTLLLRQGNRPLWIKKMEDHHQRSDPVHLGATALDPPRSSACALGHASCQARHTWSRTWWWCLFFSPLDFLGD